MASVAGVVLSPSADVLGHGGAYRGPGVTIPPPGMTPGSGTGGPGSPGVPGGAGRGPVTPGFRGRKAPPRTDHNDWATWWNFNKEPYLNLRAKLGSRTVFTDVERAGIQNVEPGVRPDAAELESSVIPALRKALADEDADVVDSAVLALARVTPKERHAEVLGDIVRTLGRKEVAVQRSAILALGVLGAPEAIPVLLAILEDAPEGRSALGLKGAVPETERGFAAVSLGLIGDPQAIAALMTVAETTKDADPDLRAGSVLGLGLFGDPAYEAVTFLAELAEDRKASDVVAAQAPIALSRLGETARPALPMLARLAVSRKTSNPVRQSCVIALGRIALPEDRDAIEALYETAESGNDDASRHFALIALGEIGARAAADRERSKEAFEAIVKYVLKQVARPRANDFVPFAATAAAFVARAIGPEAEDAEPAVRATIHRVLAEAWRDTRNPEERAALANALGLAGHEDMGEELLAALETSSDRAVNGHVAVALGLLEYDPAREPLKRILRDDNDADYRVQIATALGLMGDTDVSDLLVDEMKGAKTLYLTASIARAVGRVGDRGAVTPLLALLEDERRAGLTRAFACVALGLIGEKTPYPWNARMSVGANYLPAFFVQTEILDIL